MTKFERSSSQTNKLPLSIAIILLAIATLAIVLVIQNWQPAVAIYFLGQKSYAIPLSLAMLIALTGGAVVATIINLLTQVTKQVADRSDRNSEPRVRINNQPAQDSKGDLYEEDDFDQLDDGQDFDDDYIEVKYTRK
jgi:uncharacterized integral membrane protein